MEYGIALTPMIPMRADASEESEMVNQLLFGDTFQILESKPRWFLIENLFDHERGWIDWKMATLVAEEYIQSLFAQPVYMVSTPTADIHVKGMKAPIRLSMGSVLPGYHAETRSFEVDGQQFSVSARSVRCQSPSYIKALLRSAELYLNTSYLWGARSIFGADCSGFVQVVYRLHGINLPRNARQQILLGEPVADFAEARPGDLAFFEKTPGHVTHVGIVYTPNQILHCSGNVHIDKLTEEGIWSDRLKCYTHSRPILRRFPELALRKKNLE